MVDLLRLNDTWPIVALLLAVDGSHGQHAVAILNGSVYDANCKNELKKTADVFDWCCGIDDNIENQVVCTGARKVYQLRPTSFGTKQGIPLTTVDPNYGRIWQIGIPCKDGKIKFRTQAGTNVYVYK